MEEGVLHDGEFDALVEAVTAELGSISCVQTGDIGDVEIGVFSHVGLDGRDNLFFHFLFHNSSSPFYSAPLRVLMSNLRAGLMVVQIVADLK